MNRVPVLIVDPGCFTPGYDRYLALSLSRAGWDVELITSRHEFEPMQPLPEIGLRHLFPGGTRGATSRVPRWWRRLERAAGLPIGLFRLDRELCRRAPGIVHVQWSHLPWLDGLLWQRWQRRGWRIVYTAHDVRPLPGTTPQIFGGGYRRLARAADAVIVHSRAARAEVVEMGLDAGRVHAIPFAPTLESDGTPDRALARRRLGLDPEAPVALFFGFVKAYKGLDVLVASLPRLRAACPGARLVVAGEVIGSLSEYERLAERLAVSDAILWRPGYVPTAEVATFFAAADAVVLPYRAASSSAVLLAAYSFRRPVVATEVGGLAELVDEGITGRLVPPGDSAALSDAIAGVLANRGHADSMGARGHERLRSHHSWDAVARELDVIYRGLTE